MNSEHTYGSLMGYVIVYRLVLSSVVCHKLYGYFMFILYPVKVVVLPQVRSSGQPANIEKFTS
jgi:hypothetical protein